MLCGGSGHTTNTREGEMRGVGSIEKLTGIPIQSSRVEQEQNRSRTRCTLGIGNCAREG